MIKLLGYAELNIGPFFVHSLHTDTIEDDGKYGFGKQMMKEEKPGQLKLICIEYLIY